MSKYKMKADIERLMNDVCAGTQLGDLIKIVYQIYCCSTHEELQIDKHEARLAALEKAAKPADAVVVSKARIEELIAEHPVKGNSPHQIDDFWAGWRAALKVIEGVSDE